MSATPLDPRHLFRAGALLADTDGDDLPDAVRARIVLGAQAALPEHLAAVTIAARLGFGSLALRAPLVSFAGDAEEAAEAAHESRVPIYIGRPDTLAATCPAPLRARCAGLPAGEGVVALLDAPQPSVLVGGADDVGLNAAAHALAADLLPESAGPAVAPGPPATVGWQAPPRPRSAEGSSADHAIVLASAAMQSAPSSRPQSPYAAMRPQSQALTPALPPLRSLADLYGPHGLAVDLDGDLLPERPRAWLSLPDDLSPEEVSAAAHLGARLGLEALGLALPLARGPGEQRESPPSQITVAIEPRAGDAAVAEAGTGWIRLETHGAGQRLRVGGSDAAGRAAALWELARLDAWTTRHDADTAADRLPQPEPALAEIEQSLDRLCALVDPGTAICAVGNALRRLAHAAPASPDASLSLRVALPARMRVDREAVARCLTRWAEALVPGGPRAAVVEQRDPAVLIEETRHVAWELDDAWDVVQREVLPAIAALPADDARWRIDVRVSEPEGRRRQLQHAILERIRVHGRAAMAEQVRVLPAYFQGRAWLLETLLPRLRALPVHRIVIRARRFAPEYPSLELPIRWLQELFPVDELLATRLDLPVEAIELALDDLGTTYEAVAYDARGDELLRQGLDAAHGQRLYLPGFPAWGSVHPSTGCVRLTVGDRLVVDRHIAPDPERVWDYVQEHLLPRLARQIRAASDGAPRPERQPFFGDLVLDVWLSEEDAPLGIREERFSPLESLQEDLYFMLLDYCTALISANGDGAPYVPPWIAPPPPDQPRRGARLWTAPGRIIPRIHRREGAAGRVQVRLTAAEGQGTALHWAWGDAQGSEPLMAPGDVAIRIVGLDVQAAGATPPARCLHVTLDGTDDATRAARLLLDCWAVLRTVDPAFGAGIPRDLSFRVRDSAGVESLIPAVDGTEHTGVLLSGSHEDHADEAADARDASPVPWDRVLGSEDIAARLRVLARLPHAHAFVAGHAAQGRPSYAVELTVPRRAGWWSRAKLSAWKCTLLLNARHHANEPSSTSALLRLAELLATDPAWQRYLTRVNVILAPGENLDGMALYQELQDEHPTWMHHAARYNAAGMEYTSQYANPRTRHTEALVIPALWRRWAPDIYCDDHGFPAHAWVQPFAGHANPWFRAYWIAQALIYAYLPSVRNARYSRHLAAADALQRRMVDALAADAEIAQWNERHADRYRAYLTRWLPEQFTAPYERGTLIYRMEYDPDDAAQRQGNLAGLPGHFPGVTTASIVTEVADETAQGSYMALCARAHLLLDRVLLDYLYDANAPASIERRSLQQDDGRTLLLATRPRPVMPPS